MTYKTGTAYLNEYVRDVELLTHRRGVDKTIESASTFHKSNAGVGKKSRSPRNRKNRTLKQGEYTKVENED